MNIRGDKNSLINIQNERGLIYKKKFPLLHLEKEIVKYIPNNIELGMLVKKVPILLYGTKSSIKLLSEARQKEKG